MHAHIIARKLARRYGRRLERSVLRGRLLTARKLVESIAMLYAHVKDVN